MRITIKVFCLKAFGFPFSVLVYAPKFKEMQNAFYLGLFTLHVWWPTILATWVIDRKESLNMIWQYRNPKFVRKLQKNLGRAIMKKNSQFSTQNHHFILLWRASCYSGLHGFWEWSMWLNICALSVMWDQNLNMSDWLATLYSDLLSIYPGFPLSLPSFLFFPLLFWGEG